MAEDPSKWDVFRDSKKFERREQILEKHKKQRVNQELQEIRSHREIQEDNAEQVELKRKIERLQEKLMHKDSLLESKQDRENELMEANKKLKEVIATKDEEINVLNGGIYQLEVL